MTHPNRVLAARADLISFHPEFSTTAKGAEFVAGLLEDARALWAVRVLDAFCDAKPREVERRLIAVTTWGNNSWACQFGMVWVHYGPTPDAARLAAAEAVFPTLPADVREELGSCP